MLEEDVPVMTLFGNARGSFSPARNGRPPRAQDCFTWVHHSVASGGASYLASNLQIRNLRLLDLSHNGLTDLSAQNLANALARQGLKDLLSFQISCDPLGICPSTDIK